MSEQKGENTPLVQENGENVKQEIKIRIASRLDGVEEESEFYCGTCSAVRRSKINHRFGTWTWLCCMFWCFLTFCFGLIPFIWKKCQDREHICTECSSYVGRKEFKPFS